MTENETSLAGQVIKGYELKDLVGQGGFGEVYRAYQSLLKRDVAVKVILPRFANQTDFIRRFEAEAQIISQLENIHIVPLYDYWRDANGAFLVMRWLRGGSLQNVLEKGHWPVQDTGRVVSQLATALSVAHRNGVIHRDIKPANILLDEERNVYLADFGIAKDVSHLSDYAAQFEAFEAEMDGFIGSPDYISPEQIRNAPLGPESDIYNFGLVIYELLTGKKPFEGSPVSTLISKHLMEPLPHIQELRPDLSEALNHVIRKATAKDPNDRYSDTLELAAEFRDALLQTTREDLSELDKRATSAFDLEALGLPADFLEAEFEPLNPFKGLRAFRESDADDFFGRENLVDKLLKGFLDEGLAARFLALIGPSGSGKSSVMRAGIVPKLRHGAINNSENWFILDMIPSANPMEELEAVLLRVAVTPPESLMDELRADTSGLARTIKQVLAESGGELVLAIDQFEEVFTILTDEEERLFFLNSLATAIRDETCPLRVILTLRADFYDRPLLYPDFGQLISDYSVTVLPLNHEELSRAIIAPAERVGLELEQGLVAEIVADVSEQASSLPLLQYALTELFERRDNTKLTKAAYRQIGGVTGALARRADETYTRLSKVEQEIARQLFLRLISLGEGTEDTRRRARLDELFSLQVDDEIMRQVMDKFAQFRLLSFDRDPISRTPTVEIAHEALIRQWASLRDWLSESREELRLQRRLASAATEWKNSGKEASYLATGARLHEFETWLSQSKIGISELERDYYDESIAERSRQEAAQHAQAIREQQLQKRARNFLYGLVAVMALALVGAVALSLFAFGQRAVAESSAATASYAQGESRNLALLSGAQLALANNDTDLALVLGLAANETDSTVTSRRTLAEAAYSAGTRWIFGEARDRIETVAYSPDGLMALVGGRDSILRLVDTETGTEIRRLEGHQDWIWDVVFTPDGTHAVSASADNTLILWDLATGEIIRRFEGHSAAVRGVAISADGTKLFSGSDDRTVIVWDFETGEMLAQSEDTGSGILDVAISPSGFTGLSGHVDGTVRLWALQNTQTILSLGAEQGGHSESVWGVAYTPDELGFVSASQDSTLIRWSFESQSPILRYQGHNGRVTSLAISPDGKQIISGSEDNSLILWDMATGAILHRFVGHSFLVYAVVFSPDGNRVLSGAWDNTARLWDIRSGAQIASYSDSSLGEIKHVAISSDNRLLASASSDGAVLLWERETGEIIRRLGMHEGGANAVAFNEDGSLLLSGGNDNQLILWNVASGEIVHTLTGHSDAVNALGFSPDGTLLASAGDDNTIILWNRETGEQVNRLFGHTFHITDLDFSPDGLHLVSSGFDNLVLIWDVETGEIVHRLEGHSDWIFSVEYSPNGATIVSGAADNSLILWEAETGVRLRQYEGHSALVYDAHFSSDGQMLLSASGDRSIILWDILSGQIVQRLEAHDAAVNSVILTNDMQTIISGGADGKLNVLAVRLSVEDLQTWIRQNRYIRALSCVEQEVYGLGANCPTPTPFFLPGTRA